MRGIVICILRTLPVFLPFVIHFAAFSQCPAGLQLSTTNLITNGDFSAGNSNFTSDHSYCSTAGCLSTDSTYTVGTDPSFYESSFEGADHTSGTGNFLMVNGSTTANTAAWCQTVPVDPNSFYQINYWISSMNTQNPAQIQLYINSFPFFPSTFAPFTTNSWNKSSNMWVSGITTSANICLVNLNTNSQGNDFGLDDISMFKCECDIGVDAGLGGSICKGDSIQLTASGATSYFWSPTNSLTCSTCENPVAMPVQTTTYTITVMGPGGCTVYDSVTVEVFPTLDLIATNDTSICPGQSVQLTSSGIINYQWFPSGGLSANNIPDPVATPATSITYFLVGTDEHGCSQSDSVNIDVFTAADPFTISNDTTVCKGWPVPLHVDMEGTIEWTPSEHLSCTDCLDPLAITDTTITYTVTVIDLNGCYAGKDSVTIVVDTACDIPPNISAPSAFSPNQDGKNDYFNVLGHGIEKFQLDIYNRWGQLIFSTNDPNISWDGTFEGKKQDIGVYIWHLVGDLKNGTHVVKNGSVTLIR